MNKKQKLGSKTAKGGFENEHDIAKKFENYLYDIESKDWLTEMGYDFQKIQHLKVLTIPVRISSKKALEFGATENKIEETLKFKKADIQLQIEITIDGVIYTENISLKKANKNSNFNQIDKRPVGTYQKMWGFSDSIAETLKKFTGEIVPNKKDSRSLKDKRRWYFSELPQIDVKEVLDFFNKNKLLIFGDLIKGRGMLAAKWLLVTKKNADNSLDWKLKNINEAINLFAQGSIEISERGGLNLGKLRGQRKGGTPDPTSLQFKIKPLDLFDLD